MTSSRVELRIPGGVLILGGLPRVAGTFSSPLGAISESVREIVSDLVEIRLDEVQDIRQWVEHCRAIEAGGVPVLLTIRSSTEGGRWKGSENERLNLYETALDNVACVDVEFRSEILGAVAQRARKLQKACVVSWHDFEGTPPLAELQRVLSEAQEFGSVVKVATMVRDDRDLAILRDLLNGHWKVPICLMGMGTLGAQTRVSLAISGSCLTYGYLDKAIAPGQPSATDLVSQLRASMPGYDEDYALRRPGKARQSARQIDAPAS